MLLPVGHFLLSLFPMSLLPTRLSPLALSISVYLTLPQVPEAGPGYPVLPAPLGISSGHLWGEGKAGTGGRSPAPADGPTCHSLVFGLDLRVLPPAPMEAARPVFLVPVPLGYQRTVPVSMIPAKASTPHIGTFSLGLCPI